MSDAEVSKFLKDTKESLGGIQNGPYAKPAFQCLPSIEGKDAAPNLALSSVQIEALFLEVASGEQMALDTAMRLFDGGELPNMEGLSAAVAKALTKTPEVVLKRLSSRIPEAELVCSWYRQRRDG